MLGHSQAKLNDIWHLISDFRFSGLSLKNLEDMRAGLKFETSDLRRAACTNACG